MTDLKIIINYYDFIIKEYFFFKRFILIIKYKTVAIKTK